MSEDEKILSRIAKLLELADRGDEHEAKVAAERAAEMMAKHEISMADLRSRSDPGKPRVETGRIDAEEDASMSRVERWHKLLSAAIADAIGARVWYRGYGKRSMFLIVGPPDSVSTARYMYLHLAAQINRLSRKAGRDRGEDSNSWRRNYADGMVMRISERLRAGRAAVMSSASSTAMVHVDAQREAVKAEYDALGLKPARLGGSKRPDAIGVGYRDGLDVDLGQRDAGRLGAGQKKLT